VATAWAPVPATFFPHCRLRLRTARLDESEASLEIGFRFAAMQVGYWLGWASIVAVLVELALDVSVRHRWLLVGSTLAAAAGNTVAMVIPWREWLVTRRGRVLLDRWCGGLIESTAPRSARDHRTRRCR
jgi:hypothetical protein